VPKARTARTTDYINVRPKADEQPA